MWYFVLVEVLEDWKELFTWKENFFLISCKLDFKFIFIKVEKLTLILFFSTSTDVQIFKNSLWRLLWYYPNPIIPITLVSSQHHSIPTRFLIVSFELLHLYQYHWLFLFQSFVLLSFIVFYNNWSVGFIVNVLSQLDWFVILSVYFCVTLCYVTFMIQWLCCVE